MHGRWAVLAGLLALRCVSAPIPRPTPEHPLAMCAISCRGGRVVFAHQHLCQGGKRQFEDFYAIGERIDRNVDGSIVRAVWIGKGDSGDFDKINVETCRCAEAIRRIVESRAIGERGVYPGEPDPLHPDGR